MEKRAKKRNNYYPFGLTISDDAQPANTDQPVKFQSQQHEDDFGINIYSFKWREHDPTIGRFWQHDPLASKYVYNSPYAFSGNRVVNAVELEGLEPVFIGSDILIGDDALMKLGTEESTTESLIPKTTPVPVNAPTPAQVSLGDAIQVGIDFARATNEIFDKVSDNVQQAVDNVKDAFEKGKNDATKTSPVKNRVKLRKGTIRQIDENQPKNEHGEPIDPNDKKPLGDDKTDIGHKPGNEWRRRQVMHQEKGSSRREVIEEENNPDLYQRERSSNNRSHRYEQKD